MSEIELVDNPLVRDNEGRSHVGLLRLVTIRMGVCVRIDTTYSTGAGGFTATNGDSGIALGDERVDSTIGVGSGVGDWISIRVAARYGALCGRGEISIESFPGPGEDEGSGGVITLSNYYKLISSTMNRALYLDR